MLTLPRMAENEEPAPDDVRVLDPRTLRGLAHPLRMRLLTALREYGPATASQLADRLGESSGATSYHLRQLATYGFVEDDPERGKGRERWWKAAHRGTRWNADKFLAHPDPAVRGAANTVLHEVATQHTQEMSTFWAPCTDGRGNGGRPRTSATSTCASLPNSPAKCATRCTN
ncbi:hypothetical protein SANTM175S_04154 [Streptomyces antimycoticus]